MILPTLTWWQLWRWHLFSGTLPSLPCTYASVSQPLLSISVREGGERELDKVLWLQQDEEAKLSHKNQAYFLGTSRPEGKLCSLVPRPSPPPVFDHIQYVNMKAINHWRFGLSLLTNLSSRDFQSSPTFLLSSVIDRPGYFDFSAGLVSPNHTI